MNAEVKGGNTRNQRKLNNLQESPGEKGEAEEKKNQMMKNQKKLLQIKKV